MRTPLIAAALLGLVSIPLAAQTHQPPPVGTRVRITMPDTSPAPNRARDRSRPIVGRITAVTDSVVSVRPDAARADVPVILSRVQRLEVSKGFNLGPNVRKGALIGVVAGGVIGFAAGDDCGQEDWICFDRPSTTLFGAVAGLGLGALIGLVRSTEKWRDTAESASVSIVPTGGGGVSIGSRISF